MNYPRAMIFIVPHGAGLLPCNGDETSVQCAMVISLHMLSASAIYYFFVNNRLSVHTEFSVGWIRRSVERHWLACCSVWCEPRCYFVLTPWSV